MSVMNATTVITNSREAREPRRKNTTPFFVKIIPLDHKTLWFITNPLDCTWPGLCIYIRPIFTEDRGLAPPAPFDYWHIGLSDCFERSLQIQISFNTSISNCPIFNNTGWLLDKFDTFGLTDCLFFLRICWTFQMQEEEKNFTIDNVITLSLKFHGNLLVKHKNNVPSKFPSLREKMSNWGKK